MLQRGLYCGHNCTRMAGQCAGASGVVWAVVWCWWGSEYVFAGKGSSDLTAVQLSHWYVGHSKVGPTCQCLCAVKSEDLLPFLLGRKPNRKNYITILLSCFGWILLIMLPVLLLRVSDYIWSYLSIFIIEGLYRMLP